MENRAANFEIVGVESTHERLIIRDVGPWDERLTVTNDAENVVRDLAATGALRSDRRLWYYDSTGRLDEILHADGVFVGFRALGEGGQPPTDWIARLTPVVRRGLTS